MAKKPKRIRSAFTTDQINYLESEFKKFPYIGSGSRKETAKKLGISEKAVKIWFQNRRMKEKKESVNKDCGNEGLSKDDAVFTNEPLNNGCNWQSNNDDRYSPIKIADGNESKRPVKSFSQTTTANSMLPSENKNSSPKPEDAVRVPVSKCSNSVSIPLTKNKPNLNTAPVTLQKSKSKPNEAPTAAPKQKKICMRITSSKSQKESSSSYCQSTKSNIYQDVPHDLSSRSLLNRLCTQQLHQYPVNAISGTGYMPLNMQNCYPPSALPHGHVVWKPVNMLPAVHVPQVPQGSMGIPQNTAGTQFANNHGKSACSCNCHGPLVHSFNQVNARAHPQYIIAIPFSNQPK